MMKGVAQMGQVLAFLAALILTVDPHPLHAQSDGVAGHGYLGSFCEELDTARSTSNGNGSEQSSHGDCIHHFDPMVRAALEQRVIDVSVAVAKADVEPIRRLTLTSDPPPPRIPS
jgi:hypothetical protein